MDDITVSSSPLVSPPAVTTSSSVSSITTTGATLGGDITATGGANATETGIFYSTTSGFADGSGTKVSTTGLNVGVSTISQAVTGLSAGTTYFFKAFAINSSGSGYGGQQSFITVPSAPAAPTASGVTPNSFTASWGAVTGAASYRLDVSTASDFSSFVSGYENLTVSGTSQALTGLSSATPYYVRVRAVNAGGTSASSTSLTQATDAVTGVIDITGNLEAMTTTYGTPSSEENFEVSGTGFTGNLTVTVPSGFQVSLISGSGFGASAYITATGTLDPTPVYVRLSGSAVVGPYSGNVEISGGGATTVNVAASGTVTKATPTITVNPSATAITYLQSLASSSLSGGTASVPGSFSFTNPTTAPSAGTASQSVTFTPTDTTNYNTVFTSVNVVVNKATPTVSVAPTASAITFGQTLASSNITGGAASVPGSFAFTTPSTAPSIGTSSQSVTFTPTDADNYNTVTTSTNVTVNGATAPVLTAATGATVDGPFSVTFTNIGTWQESISGITVGGTTLSPSAYNTTVADVITFTPSASILLQSSGSKAIVVSSTGYVDAPLTQNIAAGVANKLFVSTQPTAPASNGATLAVQPIILIRDQYNNLTSSAASVTATVGAGIWTLGGTSVVTASSGMATFAGLTASSAASVTGAILSFTSTGLTGASSSMFNIPAPDFITLVSIGAAVTENFDGMAATLNLPVGWKMGASTSSPTWAGAATTVTQQASSGSPTAGGTYNWGSSASDRAVGAMTSGSFDSPNNLMVKVRNDTGSVLNALSVDFRAERYRINTAAASVSFSYSNDGSSWISVGSGDIASTSFPTGTSAYNFTTGTTITRSGVVQTGLSVANGSFFYLRWNINTTGASSQGIGIDDISITGITRPTLTTGSATAIAQTTSTLGGNIAASGGANATERGVFLSTTSGFADGAGTKVSATGSFGTGVFTVNAASLVANTTYYFKTFAINLAGTAYGTEGTFTTLAKVTPTITAPTASTIVLGQTLASSTLSGGSASDGVATVPGTFAFTTPNTAPDIGTASQEVTFTPVDTASYNTATTTASVTVLTVYNSWAESYPGFIDTAESSNPDGDGLSNLLEFAFGTDPTVSNAGSITYANGVISANGIPTTSINNITNGVDYRAAFGRRKDHVAAGLTYTVQFSAGLDVWVDSTDTPTVVASDATMEAVTVPYPFFIETARGVEKPTFFRVAVTSN